MRHHRARVARECQYPETPGSLRAVQPGPALTALRRRRRVLPLTRIGVPGQAFPAMAGLAAPLAVPASLPLRLLPRPPLFLGPDPLLRGRRPRVRAVHPQPALQLRQPQLQPPLALPRRVKAAPQHPDLGVLRPQRLPQPRVRSTQPGVIRHGLIGHAPQAPTSAAADQIDKRGTSARCPGTTGTTRSADPVNGTGTRHGPCCCPLSSISGHDDSAGMPHLRP